MAINNKLITTFIIDYNIRYYDFSNHWWGTK